MYKVDIDDLARQALNEYHKQWREQNKDKAREIQKRYWRKKALAIAEAGEKKIEVSN